MFLCSKFFCVTNYLPLADRLREAITNRQIIILPNLQLEKLVDDDFIAGFCMKGKTAYFGVFYVDLYVPFGFLVFTDNSTAHIVFRRVAPFRCWLSNSSKWPLLIRPHLNSHPCTLKG